MLNSPARSFSDVEADLSAIADEYSKLWALYGGGDRGMWDHDRKAMLCCLEGELRAKYTPEMKVSEARVNSEAHAAIRYLQQLDEYRAGREKFAAVNLRREVLIAEMRMCAEGL